MGRSIFLTTQIIEHEKKWHPKISFYVPEFLYSKQNISSRLVNDSSNIPAPMPKKEADLSGKELKYIFSNTALNTIKADTPLIMQTNAKEKYKKNFPLDPSKKKIALIVSDLGLHEKKTLDAFTSLPENLTLAFSTDTRNLKELLEAARQNGFETMLVLPTETDNFPNNDAGKNAIYSFQTPEQNKEVLIKILNQPIPISGFLSKDSAVLENMPFFLPLIQEMILEKGLIFLSTTPLDLPSTRTIDMNIKDNIYPEALDSYFAQAKEIAKQNGSTILIFPFVPIVLNSISKWIQENKNSDFQFVPVSALF